MGKYEVTISRSTRKELENFDNKSIMRIITRIKSLSLNHDQKNAKNLKGKLIYGELELEIIELYNSIFDSKYLVDVSMIRDRKDAYRF
ncbi:MAG: hypothetical protein M3R36_01360 [Bacteroidota bacterium]|nr:hypothetical protein [Bacteroidota bacterium]